MARNPKGNEGAGALAEQGWCDAQAKNICDHLKAHLSHPVRPENKDDVLRQVQNWIIRERRETTKAIQNSRAQEQATA